MFKSNLIPKIIVICGPTCSGKTKFAIKLASKLNGEIVNADSMQIYRHMNIGTAKPTKDEQISIFHHMIDIINPDDDFNAANYSKLAKIAINYIINKGQNPFVVGGTGFYIKALIKGLFENNTCNLNVKKELINEFKKYGNKNLYQKLSKIDEISAKKIHLNDSFRIIRALEIFKTTGTPMSSLHKKNSTPFLYQYLNIALFWPRPELYNRINKRVDKMISNGLIEEVRNLLNSGYLPNLKSMQALGYRHIVSFLNKHNSFNSVVELLKRDHRRYAKRQLTWFKADTSVHWLSIKDLDRAAKLIKIFLKY